jgi:hypothetical protein
VRFFFCAFLGCGGVSSAASNVFLKFSGIFSLSVFLSSLGHLAIHAPQMGLQRVIAFLIAALIPQVGSCNHEKAQFLGYWRG